MIRFDSLIEEAKEVYLLVLCDLLIDRISCSAGYEVAVEALEKCWEWIQSKNVEADQLYFYLENLDEKDIMTYMPETIECVDDETIESFWLNFHKVVIGSNVSDKLLDYMVMNYSNMNKQQSVDVLLIKQFVKDNM